MVSKTSGKSTPEITVQRAIARAERILPGDPAARGKRDPRWQAIIRVSEFIEAQPEPVWEFARRWGKHAHADLRAAVATCILEHLLEHHFELLFPRVRAAALESPRFASMLRSCWSFGQMKNRKNAARIKRLQNQLRRSRAAGKVQSKSPASQLMRFPSSVRRAPAIETWFQEHSGELGSIAQRWFEVMRDCGDDVRELLHDGHPTACVADAAFAYVNAFKAHVNVGFFRGAEIADPKHLLGGTGKFMRQVRLRPDSQVDARALKKLIETAYADMKRRLKEE